MRRKDAMMRERRMVWLAAGLLVAVGAGFGGNAGGARSSGQQHAATAQGVLPILTIRSPRPGDTVVPPWTVRYAIAGLRVGPTHPLRIRVSIVGSPERAMQLAATSQSGVVRVPDDRFFSGRRDVVFTLVRSTGTAYANSRASYTVTNLIIAGNR